MTFEQLLGLDAAKLEAMTDAEIVTYLTPYLDLSVLPEDFRPGATKVLEIEGVEEKKPRKKKPKIFGPEFDKLSKEEKTARLKSLVFDDESPTRIE